MTRGNASTGALSTWPRSGYGCTTRSHELRETPEPGTDQAGRGLVALAVADVVTAARPVLAQLRIGQAAATGWIRQWLRPRRPCGARRMAAVRLRAGPPRGNPRAEHAIRIPMIGKTMQKKP